MIKTYSEMIKLQTFKERYNYLKLNGVVGEETFGFDRYLNQQFYKSDEWKRFRNYIIIRDGACNLAVDGYEIKGRILIHHINPINAKDILNKSDLLFDENNVVCISHDVHNAIHYGDETLLEMEIIERTEYDTCPWKK